jgi:2-dehydro-3-deoxy-D-gluconate 5-dehydrogenase
MSAPSRIFVHRMSTPEFRLDGLTALVTGCSRGIGLGIATALANAGTDIIGVSATLAASGSEVERQVTAAGRKFKGYSCDFGDRKELYDFIGRLRKDAPRIDILINNAGIIRRKPAAEHPDEYWDEVIEVNLNAQFVLTREIGKEMLARKAGKVVFIASMLTFQGGVNVVSYAASKGHWIDGQGPGERMGRQRRQRERNRAGIYRDRQHGRAAGG